jgi:hypothetical protein
MMGRLCAICADRPATTVDIIDGRVYSVCKVCLDGEPVDPGYSEDVERVPMTARILLFLRRAPGATLAEIALATDAPVASDRASYLSFLNLVMHLRKTGRVASEPLASDGKRLAYSLARPMNYAEIIHQSRGGRRRRAA